MATAVVVLSLMVVGLLCNAVYRGRRITHLEVTLGRHGERIGELREWVLNWEKKSEPVGDDEPRILKRLAAILNVATAGIPETKEGG